MYKSRNGELVNISTVNSHLIDVSWINYQHSYAKLQSVVRKNKPFIITNYRKCQPANTNVTFGVEDISYDRFLMVN